MNFLHLLAIVSFAAAQDLTPLREGYKEIFLQTFDNVTEIDQSLWSYQFMPVGAVNGELQTYNDKHASIQNGSLVMTCDQTNGQWEASRLTTAGKFSFKTGFIEARMKMSTESGVFPAFWMMPENFAGGDWPKYGEIDIMEYQSVWDGPEGKKTPNSLHTFERHGANSINNYTVNESPQDFHVYALEWKVDSMTFYRDGNVTAQFMKPENAEVNQWPFNERNFSLIANMAVQPSWGSPAVPETSNQALVIDWIRVSQINL